MIRVDSIAPDIAFCDVDVIPNENVTRGEKIGEGGFGEVFQVRGAPLEQNFNNLTRRV